MKFKYLNRNQLNGIQEIKLRFSFYFRSIQCNSIALSSSKSMLLQIFFFKNGQQFAFENDEKNDRNHLIDLKYFN